MEKYALQQIAEHTTAEHTTAEHTITTTATVSRVYHR